MMSIRSTTLVTVKIDHHVFDKLDDKQRIRFIKSLYARGAIKVNGTFCEFANKSDDEVERRVNSAYNYAIGL